MTTKRRTGPLLTLGAVLSAYACGTTEPEMPDPDPGPPAAVASVDVAGAPTSFASLGETAQLTATPRDASGAAISGKTVAWSSSSGSTASVSSTGLVTAEDNGSATITATVDGVDGTASVTVAQIATLLTFSGQPADVEEGEAIEPAVRVDAVDARDNVVSTFTEDVTIALGANPGGASLSGTVTVAASAGEAHFTDLRLDEAADGYTLVASSGALTSATSAPFNVSAPAQAPVWTHVAAGGNHTCGLRTGGRAYCWGNGENGRLGTGTGGPLRRPTPVLGGHEFVALAAGDVHSCGITTTGAAYCWGRNQYGELGIGEGDGVWGEPEAVDGGLSFRTIAAGMLRGTCGITTDDLLYCWGLNQFGEVGDGTRENRNIPALVAGGHEWRSVARHLAHTCGVADDGEAYCWGRNDHGQHGNGGFVDSNTPTLVGGGGGDYTSITTGLSIACAVATAGGGGACWGDNGVGQLGDGTMMDRLGPAAVLGGPFSMMGGGGGFTCGLHTDGRAFCWGDGFFGQLGNGQTNQRHSTPQLVEGGHTFESISVAGHACAVTTDGALYCWGFNESGQLGDGSTLNRDSPVQVLDPTS